MAKCNKPCCKGEIKDIRLICNKRKHTSNCIYINPPHKPAYYRSRKGKKCNKKPHTALPLNNGK